MFDHLEDDYDGPDNMAAYLRWAHRVRMETPTEFQYTIKDTWADYLAAIREAEGSDEEVQS